MYVESIPADERHLKLDGQDIYLAALKTGDKIYSVKIKVDIEKNRGARNYKDHKISEIEIAPVVFAGQSAESRGVPPRIGAIDTIKLSDLVSDVKKDDSGGIRYSVKDRDNVGSLNQAFSVKGERIVHPLFLNAYVYVKPL